MKAKSIGIIVFLSLAMIIGICLLFFGIGGTFGLSEDTKDYEQTEGRLVNYRVYSQDENGTTYRLIYSYTVDRHEYIVTTDSGTQIIPKENSTRTVKYNPENPQEALVVGSDTETALVFLGIMFFFIPLIMLLAFLHQMGYLPNLYNLFFHISLGAIFVVLGFGSIYLITGEFSIVSIFNSFDSSYILILAIPLMLVAVGIFVIVKSIVEKLNKNAKSEKRNKRYS